jgi:capsular exopolysaccharide synthesis family protein
MSQLNTADRPKNELKKAGGGINVRVVLHAIQRHPLALFGVMVLAAAAMASVWFFLPLPKKSAAVMFYISSQPHMLLGPTLESRLDFGSYKQSQLALIKNRRTLNAALNDPDVRGLAVVNSQRDPIMWLDRSLIVDARGGGEFMRLAIEGENGDELLTILKAVVKAYLAAAHDRDNGDRIRRQEELEKKDKETRDELKGFQDKIDEIAISLRTADGPTLVIMDAYRRDGLQRAIQTVAALNDELTNFRNDLTAAKNTTKRSTVISGAAWASALISPGTPFGLPLLPVATSMAWTTIPPSAIFLPPALVEEELHRDPTWQKLKQEAARTAQHYKETEARLTAGVNSEVLKNARAASQAAEERLGKYELDMRGKVEAFLKEKYLQNEEAWIASLQAKCDQKKLEIDRADAKIKDIEKEISKYNVWREDLQHIRSKIEKKERVSGELAEQIERLKVEGKVPPRVTISEDPYIVEGIEGNRRLKFAIMTCLGTFLVGFGLVVAWEYRSRRVTHAEEVSTALGTRLIGTIPPFTSNARNVSPTDDFHKILVEAIDTTRTMLMHAAPAGTKQRVLIVTSALAGEGKTTLSGHLAISLTRAGFRTLLVDGDMHAPSAHALFDLPSSPGLSEVLCGQVDLTQAVRPSPIPGLSILPAGKWTMATRQMLVRDRWQRLKQEMEANFDFVVVDTSPLLLVTDTILLAREADCVILSVLLGVSQVARVSETMDRLNALGVELAGVVVNNVRGDAYHHKYAYQSKYPALPNGDGFALSPEKVRIGGTGAPDLVSAVGVSAPASGEASHYAEECSE